MQFSFCFYSFARAHRAISAIYNKILSGIPEFPQISTESERKEESRTTAELNHFKWISILNVIVTMQIASETTTAAAK